MCPRAPERNGIQRRLKTFYSGEGNEALYIERNCGDVLRSHHVSSICAMIVSFGQSQHERIEIDVISYERSPVGEHDDDNWLTIEIGVLAGGFRGKARAAIVTGELLEFLTQLRSLYQSLSGTAEFTTLEGQLHLKATGDGKGHVELVGMVADQPGIGNRLHFTLQFDRSQLGASIHELEKVTEAFPVRSL